MFSNRTARGMTLELSMEEYIDLRIMLDEWRHFVRQSNRYGDNCESDIMNEYIDNVRTRGEGESAADFLEECEHLALQICNPQPNFRK